MRRLLAATSGWGVFAGCFGAHPLWGLLFGTYRSPDANPVERVGIPGGPVPTSFVGPLLGPFRARAGLEPEPEGGVPRPGRPGVGGRSGPWAARSRSRTSGRLRESA